MTYSSHLTFLVSAAAQFPQKQCFKLPQFEAEDDRPHRKIIGWTDITYGKFLEDVDLCAKYWIKTLQSPLGSIVGLWMFGMTYRDFVHLFGLSMARFVPQILNLKIDSVDAAINHFKQSNITHVIHAPTAPIASLSSHFQVHGMVDIEQLSVLVGVQPHLVYLQEEENGDDVVMIYHTSGSTSGRPKLVRHTRKWIDGNSRNPLPSLPDGAAVAIAMNGISHVSQYLISLQQFANRECVVLMPWIDFTGAELVQIIKECGVNVLYQLTPILSRIIREAMTNSDLEMALKSLKLIVCGGSILGDNERLWVLEKGLDLRDVYGSTEMWFAMRSGKSLSIFHPSKAPGFIYELQNVNSNTETEDPASKLVELVIPPSSFYRPHPSLCDPNDGYYRSRDLFQEVEPGGYKYRGRLDDMILMSRGQFCDSLYIEGQVLLTCKDLISSCVVVGSGKPSPILLVEPSPVEAQSDVASLKNRLGKKVGFINKDGFPHERIYPSCILVVPPGALPRTPKGNISRGVAERMFRRDIDAIGDDI